MMKNIDLDKAFRKTPSAFSQRLDQTLNCLEEGKPVKRLALRTVAIALLIVLLLGSVGYAMITQGLGWYYSNRMELTPQKYQVVMNNVQTNLDQQDGNNQYVNVAVKDAAWLPKENALTVLLTATVKDPANIELHPMWNIDADGSYVGLNAANLVDEDRNEHWLWTKKGHGPVREMMEDSSKKLILFEAEDIQIVSLEGEQTMLPQYIFGHGTSMDAIVGEDGSTITVLDMHLDYLAEDYEEQLAAIGDDEERARMEQKFLNAREVLEKNTDENGMLTLLIPYTVTEYVADNDEALYLGRKTETITCRIKVK